MGITKLTPIQHTQVRVAGGFLGDRIQANREKSLQHQYQQCKATGRIESLKLKWRPGRNPVPHEFWDSDLAKWIEAAAFSIATNPNEKLENQIDELVELLAAAQQPDGYLNSYFTQVRPAERWTNLRDDHELYCAGHLIEAAVALYNVDGNRKLLDVMSRYADYIAKVFGPGNRKKKGYPGHEEIELALVKLYRATGEVRYLDLAKFFIDERGKEPHYFDKEAKKRREKDRPHPEGQHSSAKYDYLQAHLPVREQDTAEGHAVRACYLYSGMADVGAETGDRELIAACKHLWKNITEKRMYIHGGIGSSRFGERFTRDYDLPNEEAYAETCAAIALIFFAHRMLQLEADSEYSDVLERALYNGVLSGVSLDGKGYFYANPLAINKSSIGTPQVAADWKRQTWFECACCPSNLSRLLSSIGGYMFSKTYTALYVHLYADSTMETKIGNRLVRLVQKTEYPWEGDVVISVHSERAGNFSLALRIPSWCRRTKIKINGKTLDHGPSIRRGYAHIKRLWNDGDRVELQMQMPVERVYSHPSARHTAGRFAIQRGPVLFCVEEKDNGSNLHDIIVPKKNSLHAAHDPEHLGGAAVIVGDAYRRKPSHWGKKLYKTDPEPREDVIITAIPYCLWNNRDPGEMAVWLLEK